MPPSKRIIATPPTAPWREEGRSKRRRRKRREKTRRKRAAKNGVRLSAPKFNLLLSIPAEVRERIYFFAMLDDFPRQSAYASGDREFFNDRLNLRVGPYFWWHRTFDCEWALLLVNRQINKEATYVFYTQFEFFLDMSHELDLHMSWFVRAPRPLLANIRTICLGVSNDWSMSYETGASAICRCRRHHTRPDIDHDTVAAAFRGEMPNLRRVGFIHRRDFFSDVLFDMRGNWNPSTLAWAKILTLLLILPFKSPGMDIRELVFMTGHKGRGITGSVVDHRSYYSDEDRRNKARLVQFFEDMNRMVNEKSLQEIVDILKAAKANPPATRRTWLVKELMTNKTLLKLLANREHASADGGESPA